MYKIILLNAKLCCKFNAITIYIQCGFKRILSVLICINTFEFASFYNLI